MNRSNLLIEDEPLLSRNIVHYLHKGGYDATPAMTLARGIVRPDAVVVDHNLPDGTGIELIIRQARREQEDRHRHRARQRCARGQAMKAGADD